MKFLDYLHCEAKICEYADFVIYQADGTCAIEPMLLPHVMSGTATYAGIAQGAALVIKRCVAGDPSTGGLVRDFGKETFKYRTVLDSTLLM